MKCVQCHGWLKTKNVGGSTWSFADTLYYCDNSSMYTVRGVGDDGKEADIPHRCPLYHVLQVGE